MENPVIIFGAGALGRAALEIFQRAGVVVYCFLDENEELHGKEIDTVSVLGSMKDDGFLKLIGKKCEAFVALEDPEERAEIVRMLLDRRKVMPCNAVHPQAIVASSASLGHGNMINAGVIVGAGAEIGHHCLLHTGAIVEPNAKLADFVQVGAGSIVGAGAQLGKQVQIGHGATVVPNIKLEANAKVISGSVVLRPVKEDEVVFGVPAQPMSTGKK